MSAAGSQGPRVTGAGLHRVAVQGALGQQSAALGAAWGFGGACGEKASETLCTHGPHTLLGTAGGAGQACTHTGPRTHPRDHGHTHGTHTPTGPTRPRGPLARGAHTAAGPTRPLLPAAGEGPGPAAHSPHTTQRHSRPVKMRMERTSLLKHQLSTTCHSPLHSLARQATPPRSLLAAPRWGPQDPGRGLGMEAAPGSPALPGLGVPSPAP